MHAAARPRSRSQSARQSRLIGMLLSCLLLALGLVGAARAQGSGPLVSLEVEGIISPVTARYLVRGLEAAERDRAHLVVIRLNTPGGLFDSTRVIVEALLNAGVPTAVYVAPKGARAASAGTFITAAANIAALAPGTNIGAAAVVGGGGEELPPTLASKATNDAAAMMRAIAAERGRNAQKLEETVRQAASFTAQEAVELGIADLVAEDLSDLLRQINGRHVVTARGEVVLDTTVMEVRQSPMNWVERLLAFIANPNVVFLLLSLGAVGLLMELVVPGHVLPGVVGAFLLVLAFVGIGNLPVNWAGVAFLFLAMVLLFLELQVAGFGALGVGAIISFILGGLLLFYDTGAPSPTMPRIGVSLWLLVPTALLLLGGGGLVLSTMVRSRRAPADAVAPTLLGATGYVVSDLDPRGTVQVTSEMWSAVSQTGERIPSGRAVRVVQAKGALLTVAPADGPSPSSPPLPGGSVSGTMSEAPSLKDGGEPEAPRPAAGA